MSAQLLEVSLLEVRTVLIVAESDKSFPRIELVPRWSREGRTAYEPEREDLLFDFFLSFFLTGCKVFRSGRKLVHERGRGFFFFRIFGFIFIVFAVLLGRAVLSLSSYIQVQT